MAIQKGTPFNHGSGLWWLAECDDQGSVTGTWERAFWIKDSKRVNNASTTEVAAEGDEKFQLDSAESYTFEGTLLVNDINVDDFLTDTTKLYQIVKEDTAKKKPNGKYEYTAYPIAKLVGVSERPGKGTERSFKFEIQSAPDDITINQTLTDSKATGAINITVPKGKFYKTVEL